MTSGAPYINGHLKVSNDKRGTPLYRAVTNVNAAIARLLIDHGATGYCGGHLGVVKPLLRWGADADVVNKATGRSAGELASENGQADVAKFISEYNEYKYPKQVTFYNIGHS